MVIAILGASTAAHACPVVGKIVCDTDSSKGVSGVLVSLQTLPTGPLFSTTSSSDGSVAVHVDYTLTSYLVNLTGGTVYCDANGSTINLGTIAVADSVQCPGTTTAGCSPGFFKNNLPKWCAPGSAPDMTGLQCTIKGITQTYSCTQLVCLLSAEPPCKSDAKTRADAAACLNAIVSPNICPGG